MENGYPETSPATPPHEATAALPLSPAPPPEQWGDWVEFDASDWPRKTEKHYAIVPAACPGCEGACGLLVYVDRENGSVRRVEGNPHHPGSRGGICMASAIVSRIQSPDRIVQPLKRAGLRGEGIWQPIDWETALREIGSEIHSLLLEGKGSEIVLESGLSGPYEIRSRISNSWGGCTHNPDPPLLNISTSPDLESARFILLIGAGSESAFVRHSKQIIAARLRGAKTAAINPHLSNAASQCDFWLPARPGSEATLLLAIVNTLLAEEIFDAGHLRLASDWQDSPETSYEDFIQALKHRLSRFTPGYAASVSGAPESRILATAREIGRAGTSFCSVFSGRARPATSPLPDRQEC
jgi:anaerobic selenocysteine-containing dehydrogenase